MNTTKIGVVGENIAAKYLAKHGYVILQRNFSSRFGEIDIIAKHGEFFVFVEVKRRKTDKFGLPREAVTPYKQQTIATCAKYWLSQNKLYGAPVRFDVVEVQDKDVVLIADAFRMPEHYIYKKN